MGPKSDQKFLIRDTKGEADTPKGEGISEAEAGAMPGVPGAGRNMEGHSPEPSEEHSPDTLILQTSDLWNC